MANLDDYKMVSAHEIGHEILLAYDDIFILKLTKEHLIGV